MNVDQKESRVITSFMAVQLQPTLPRLNPCYVVLGSLDNVIGRATFKIVKICRVNENSDKLKSSVKGQTILKLLINMYSLFPRISSL